MSKRKLALATTGLAAAIGVVSILLRGGTSAGAGGVALNAPTAGSQPVSESGQVQGESAYIEIGVWNWVTSAYKQNYTVFDFREVEVTDHVQAPPSGVWSSRTHYGSASFDILRASSSHNDDFAFAGFAGDGDLVVENWKLKPKKWVPLDNPSMPTKIFKKTEVYRGALATDIRTMDFDPEARFILVLVGVSGHARLYRFANAASSPPTLLLDSDDLPELDEVQFLGRLQHVSLGRVWMFDDQPIYTTRILLVDGNNDGVFDGPPLVYSRADFEASFDNFSDWDPLLGP